MKYVALLRGINVGGKNKVGMSELKQSFEKAGMTEVSSYINTGNILFESISESKEELTKRLVEVVFEDFELTLDILLRSRSDMISLMDEIPEHWVNNKEMKCDVLFLFDEVDTHSVLNQLTIKQDIDTVFYLPGAVVWSVDRSDVTKSGLMKLAGMALYKKTTIRNINTTRKIVQLMND